MVTDANGCQGSDSLAVTVNANPTVTITATPGATVCDGTTVTLDAGAGFTTYLWTPGGETTQTIDVTTADTYGVTVTDANGCQGSDSLAVTVDPLPHIENIEVFYVGMFSDEPDPSHPFLAPGSTATNANITNYELGITGIRVFFDDVVSFAGNPKDAFTFEWTTGMGSTFSPVTDVATMITVTTSVDAGRTVAAIVIANDHVKKRWLKVTLEAAQVSLGGCVLDGELSGNPVLLPSGDGVGGGDAVFCLGSLPGEVTGDRKVMFDDVGAVRLAMDIFTPVPITDIYDVDKDGKVLFGDVNAARAAMDIFFTLPLISP
jgi:hypothetical protein